MNKHLRKPLAGIAAGAAAAGLAACGSVASTSASSSTGSSTITIAGVYSLTSDPFWTTMGCGAKKEAATLGVTYKEYTTSGSDASIESQNLNSAELINPSGIINDPENPNQSIAQYKTLMAKGVPVVTMNGTTPAAQYKIVETTTTGSNFDQQLANLIPSTAGTMAVIDGIPGLVPVEVRLKPVVDAISSRRPQLQVLPTQYTEFDVNKATQDVSALLIAHPDLRVIVAADGPDGQATAAAVKAAGKSGQVKVVALDATPAEVSAMKQGLITALVAQSPTQIGEQSVKTLVDYIKAHPAGGQVPASSDVVGVPERLLTKDNVGDAANSDWVYTANC